MKATPSAIPGVALITQEDPGFREALSHTASLVSLDRLEPALPFSVIVINQLPDPIAFFGVRFDMLDAKARPCCVMHYADTLRNPEKAGLTPGACRFVCAEAAFTALAAEGRDPSASAALSNIGNLKRMLQIRASLDCVAFSDGRFSGPDSLGAFARLAAERAREVEVVRSVLGLAGEPAAALEAVTKLATEGDRVEKHQARRLLEAFAAGGFDALIAKARTHRPRIELLRCKRA